MTLSWGKSEDDIQVTSYDIYQEDTRIHSVSGAETTAQVSGLRPGTVYTFTVRARDAAENSSPDSAAVDLTTPAAPGKGPSTAPTGLRATARKGSIDLTWTPPDTGGEPVEAHELYLNGKPATTIVWGAMPTGPTAAYTMTVTDKPGTRYSIKLRAKLPDGKWGTSRRSGRSWCGRGPPPSAQWCRPRPPSPAERPHPVNTPPAPAPTHRVQIEYCTQCRWLPRAAWLAQELLTTFEAELDELALKPGTGGVFVVRVDGDVVWDRREHGFPEPTAVKRLVRDRVAPGRTLGHSDRSAE